MCEDVLVCGLYSTESQVKFIKTTCDSDIWATKRKQVDFQDIDKFLI